MLFNSLDYIVFLPVVVVAYFLCPQKWRWLLLLAGSYYFYACWKVQYLSLIIISTLVDYGAAIAMSLTARRSRRRAYLIVSLVVNLGLLFTFKYYNFVGENVQFVFDSFNIFYELPRFDLLLPVGISFYTFQTLSYTIDVYKGKRPPEKHLGMFALYVSFFPQLVAGPIERSSRLLPQFRAPVKFDWARIISGAQLILWGLFKKIVIADRLAMYVATVYGDFVAHSGLQILTACYFFLFQLYCDFSGYSDIAVGSGRMLGIQLSQNFNRPFAAKSYAVAWQRWHITLTKWIRDYLYIPLAGTSGMNWNRNTVTMITMAAFGIWHGAAWNFICFGLFTGTLIVIGKMTHTWRKRILDRIFPSSIPLLKKMRHFFQVLVTFQLIVASTAIFRLNHISDIKLMLSRIFTTFDLDLRKVVLPNFSMHELQIALGAIVVLEIVQYMQAHGDFYKRIFWRPLISRWAVCYLLIFSLLIVGEFNIKPFIYFEF